MVSKYSSIEQLISGMKREDTRQKRMAMVFRWFYIVLSVPYILRFVLLPDADMTLSDRLFGAFIGAGLLVFAVVFWLQHRQLKSLDYSQPVLFFLKSSLKRYKFWKPIVYPILIAAAFVGAGLTINLLDERPVHYTITQWVLIVQFAYWSMLGVSIFIGYVVWRYRERPLFMAIKRMLRETEE